MDRMTISAVAAVLAFGAAFAFGQDAPPTSASAPSFNGAMLYDFEEEAAAKDWAPMKLPGVKDDAPAPKIEVVADKATSGKRCLKLTFDGGDWSFVATSKVPVEGNWSKFRAILVDLTVDRPLVAYFRVVQGKLDEKGNPLYWQRTVILQPGRNEMTVMIRGCFASMSADSGDVKAFTIGAFRPEKGQTLLVDNVRLSRDPLPTATGGFYFNGRHGYYTPYNHDGFSAAVQREHAKGKDVPMFKVLGTDMEVLDVYTLAKQFEKKWTKPEDKTIEQVEADFTARFEQLKKDHPKAVMTILRTGEKGYDPANPDKAFDGWKWSYVNCHGPDGPNSGRENTPAKTERVEAFMRHRNPLMRVDLSSIPKGAAVLAASLVITRTADTRDGAKKPNLWVAEPCNREWDDQAVNCYFYAKGKPWKAIGGMYYGEDPDFFPVFLMYGPGAPINVWDFTAGLRFWLGEPDGKGAHENHGFFLYADGPDYMHLCTPKAAPKLRPAMMVVYEPKQ